MAEWVSIDNDMTWADFTGKKVMYSIAPDYWNFENIIRFEESLNRREYRSRSEFRHRILPYGMTPVNYEAGEAEQQYPDKVLIRCAYCKQFGAIYCPCPQCGAPIGVPSYM